MFQEINRSNDNPMDMDIAENIQVNLNSENSSDQFSGSVKSRVKLQVKSTEKCLDDYNFASRHQKCLEYCNCLKSLAEKSSNLI